MGAFCTSQLLLGIAPALQCVLTFLVSSYSAVCSSGNVRSMTDTLRVRMQETISDLPFSSEITLPTALTDAGMMFWVAPRPSFQFPRGALHHLLGGGDGMECSHESINYARVIRDDLGWVGTRQLTAKKALFMTLSGLSWFLWPIPITNLGATSEDPRAGSRQWAPNFFMVVKTPVDCTTALLDVGRISLLEDRNGLPMTCFLFSDLTMLWNLLCVE